MNKALHILVYLFLIIAGVGLWFEIELNAKRALLTERNRMQEDYLVKIARTIEKAEPNKDVQTEIKKDVSNIEAKIVKNIITVMFLYLTFQILILRLHFLVLYKLIY